MGCNCKNNNTSSAKKIRHVFGNEITMIIPLTRRKTVTRNGTPSDTDDSQLPRINNAVVRLEKNLVHYDINARVEGYYVSARDKGTIPIGTYSITVLCEDFDGRPMRYKKNTVLEVVDSTAEGGVYDNDEIDVVAYYPIISGRSSAVVIGDDDVTITGGKNFGGDDTPEDEFADINAVYGEGSVEVTDNEVILTI